MIGLPRGDLFHQAQSLVEQRPDTQVDQLVIDAVAFSA